MATIGRGSVRGRGRVKKINGENLKRYVSQMPYIRNVFERWYAARGRIEDCGELRLSCGPLQAAFLSHRRLWRWKTHHIDGFEQVFSSVFAA
jgi:hypothetical protein